MQITINDKVFDYNTIAQFVERKMNGANVHDLRVDLAVIRSIFVRHDKGHLITERDTGRLLAIVRARIQVI